MWAALVARAGRSVSSQPSVRPVCSEEEEGEARSRLVALVGRVAAVMVAHRPRIPGTRPAPRILAAVAAAAATPPPLARQGPPVDLVSVLFVLGSRKYYVCN